MIYFDNAATSLIKPKQVKDCVIKSINYLTANPGRSGHIMSQKVAEEIYATREDIKKFFNAKDYDLIFTKNCTEALNLAIIGNVKNGDHIITTCYEHNSVLRVLEFLKNKGVEITILDCSLYDFSSRVEEKIKPNTKMIITTYVSNVTGEVCEVEKVSKICKKHNVLYLVDGAQACGHIDIDLNKLAVDMFAFAGHKGLLSLTGVGGLFVKNILNMSPIIYGGTGTESENLKQPTATTEGFEAGTIPSISILSLGAGIQFLSKNRNKIIEKEQFLTEYLINSLKKLQNVKIYSKNHCCNVVSFNLENIDCMEVANILNERYKICVRAGYHCAPLIHKKLKTNGAVRVSIDFNNSIKEIDYFVYALKKLSLNKNR